MPKKYIVTGKNVRNVYLRTNSLNRAIAEAGDHKHAYIYIYKRNLDDHVIMREVVNGKKVPFGTIEKSVC